MSFFQAAFDNSPHAQTILTYDQERKSFRYVAANLRFFQYTGLNAESIIGQYLHDHLATPHADSLSSHFLHGLRTTEPHTFETIVSVPSGTRNWQITVSPMHKPDGSPPDTIITTPRDITWSGDLAQRLNLIGDELPGFVYQLCYHPSKQWYFTFVGNRVTSMFGVKASEVMHDALKLLDLIHPDDIEWVQNKTAREIHDQANWHAEFRMQHPAGHTVWVEAYDMLQQLADGTKIWTGYLNDITSKKNLEASLLQSEARYRTLVENAYDIILNLDGDGTLNYVSPSWKTTLGDPSDLALGRSLSTLLHPQDVPACTAYVNGLMAGAHIPEGTEFRIRHANGQWRWFVAHGSSFKDYLTGAINLILIARDVTERRQMEQEIQYLAHHDALTGLNNRVSFMANVQRALQNSRRNGQQFAILYIDLDRFKPVNDTLGHAAGDLLLQQVAQRLKGSLRSMDSVGRIGGDEFMVLLDDIDNEDIALAVATKLGDVLEQPFMLGSDSANISASIGIALYPKHGRDFDSLSNAADHAMYRAKTDGKSRVALPSSTGA